MSCDPAIYAEGGFLDDPALLEPLRSAPPAGIETVARLYGPAAYPRPPANVFADGVVVASVGAFNDRVDAQYPGLPACALVRIGEALILDRAVHVVHDGATRPLYETARPGDRAFALAVPAIGEVVDLPDDRAHLLLTSAGTFNWGHWLVDDLPRLAALRALAGGGRVRVLLHGFDPATDAARIAALRLVLGRRASHRILLPNRVYRARGLHYATPVSVHPGLKHPAALADLAEAGRAASAPRWPWSRGPGSRRPAASRLFVTRRVGRGRVPCNLHEVEALVRARGFAPVDPEALTAPEQIALFAGAERVVGLMGAAMTTTLFCAPGTRVLHLAPETFPEPFYWDLAAARGHAYGVVYGRALDPAEPAATAYRVDPAHLARALDWLG